ATVINSSNATASALSPVISGILGPPCTHINHSQNGCRRACRQPFPACDWNRSLGGALFAKRKLGLELLDHPGQRRAWPPPVIGFHFRERFFERTALLHDLVEVIDHGRACCKYPVRARGCRRPVIAGSPGFGWMACATVLGDNGLGDNGIGDNWLGDNWLGDNCRANGAV